MILTSYIFILPIGPGGPVGPGKPSVAFPDGPSGPYTHAQIKVAKNLKEVGATTYIQNHFYLP